MTMWENMQIEWNEDVSSQLEYNESELQNDDENQQRESFDLENELNTIYSLEHFDQDLLIDCTQVTKKKLFNKYHSTWKLCIKTDEIGDLNANLDHFLNIPSDKGLSYYACFEEKHENIKDNIMSSIEKQYIVIVQCNIEVEKNFVISMICPPPEREAELGLDLDESLDITSAAECAIRGWRLSQDQLKPKPRRLVPYSEDPTIT